MTVKIIGSRQIARALSSGLTFMALKLTNTVVSSLKISCSRVKFKTLHIKLQVWMSSDVCQYSAKSTVTRRKMRLNSMFSIKQRVNSIAHGQSRQVLSLSNPLGLMFKFQNLLESNLLFRKIYNSAISTFKLKIFTFNLLRINNSRYQGTQKWRLRLRSFKRDSIVIGQPTYTSLDVSSRNWITEKLYLAI